MIARFTSLPLLVWLAASPAWAESPAGFAVPSGQPVTLVERLDDPEGPAGLTWRYRFLAPAIARDTGTVALDAALTDIDALCATIAVGEANAADVPPAQVVLTLMDRLIPFGQPAPEATQYIEAYRVEDGLCVWEGF